MQTLSENVETGFIFIVLVESDLLFGIFEASSEAMFSKYLLKCLTFVMLSVTVLPLMTNLLLEEPLFFLLITSLIRYQVFLRLFLFLLTYIFI